MFLFYCRISRLEVRRESQRTFLSNNLRITKLTPKLQWIRFSFLSVSLFDTQARLGVRDIALDTGRQAPASRL